MALSRRSFMKSGAMVIAASGSMAQVISSTTPAQAQGRRRPFEGYGSLVPDPFSAALLALGCKSAARLPLASLIVLAARSAEGPHVRVPEQRECTYGYDCNFTTNETVTVVTVFDTSTPAETAAQLQRSEVESDRA